MSPKKTVSLIAALDENRLIGRAGGLPWRLPNDLRHFKALTLGKTILMGRKTWDSLGCPLPQREHWVLTRAKDFSAEGCRVFANVDEALSAHVEGELMVVGGAEIYRQTLPAADRLYLTHVHARLEGDTWFPEYDAAQFRVSAHEDFPADERHAFAYTFETLERRR
ncbi:MAG: dihydrofolate reductase [Stenotrophobium sp.]